MTRTTLCLFALGLSVSMAAACGDDDDDNGVGGSAGRAGSGGRAGAAGTGGAAGRGGAGGSAAGTGGAAAGTGGAAAGTGGAAAGTGGAAAGTGGTGGVVEPPDAGPDGGDVVDLPDGGVSCPANLAAASANADTSVDAQEVIITRLVFVGGDAPDCDDEENGCIEVTFRAVNGDFDFADPLVLCTGSEDDDCDAGVADLEATLADGGVSDVLEEGEEVTFTTPLGEIVSAASGEIALVNGLPSDDADAIIRAYVNWGDYDSLDPTTGGDDLETRAAAEATEGVWTAGESIEVGPNTTIYAVGNDVTATAATNWAACTQN